METRAIVLCGLAALFALLASVLWLVPSRVVSPALDPTVVAVGDSAGTPRSTGTGPSPGAIIAGNLFSPERKAPRVAPARPTRPAQGPRRPGIKLVGTLQTPSGAVALIDADPTVAGAEMYRAGDRVGDSQLISVDDSSAVLQGPSGRQVLRLP